MRSGILRTQIDTLRLRMDAPFPSQQQGRMWRWLRFRVVSAGTVREIVQAHRGMPLSEASFPHIVKT